jgi:hypothetical protein
MPFQFNTSHFAYQKVNFLTLLTSLSLTTNLKLLLDAGDSSSYTSGQKWLDRSGGGYDFFLGTTSGAEASDPTFKGTAGGESTSEYWSFDGGDRFQYDTTNETWMQDLHKDSAVWSAAMWFYWPSSTEQTLFGDVGVLTPTGVQAFIDTIATGPGHGNDGPGTGVPNLRVGNAAGVALLTANTNGRFTAGRWNFFGLRLNESAGTGAFVCNGMEDTFTSTYSSPAAGNAGSTFQLGGVDGGTALPSGSRMAFVAIWQGTALTTAQLNSIYKGSVGRFGQ